MLRKESEAVSEGNGPVHQEEEFGFGQPAPVDVYRQIKLMMSRFEEQVNMLEKRLARLEHDARQPRLAMEAEGQANTKTRERTEGAATAVQAMHGDSCTAQKVQDGPKTSISFGVKAEPADLSCRADVLVEDGAAVPKSCLPFLEMRTTTAADGLVSTGKTSTATETNFNQRPLWFYSTEETDSDADSKERTLTPYISYGSSVFQKSYLPAAPYSRRVVETKSRQNRTFDSGGSQGHFHACPFLGSWRAFVCGEVMHAGAAGDEPQRFSEEIRWLF